METTPPAYSPCRRHVTALILVLCLAFLVTAAAGAAATVHGAVPEPPAVLVQRTIALATTTPPPVTCQAPCSCMEPAWEAIARGAEGFTRCNENPCGYSYTAGAKPIAKYCLKQKAAPDVAVRPQVTLTHLGRVSIPGVTTTTKIPVQQVTLLPGGICPDDADCDGRPDAADNCPAVANLQQIDSDSSILWSTCSGNACKTPAAPDLMNCEGSPGSASYENCMKKAWEKANPGSSCLSSLDCQHSTDNAGDACDNCRELRNPDQADSDDDCTSLKNDPAYGDGTGWLKDPRCGDACDQCPGFDDSKDADQNGVPDACDPCPQGPVGTGIMRCNGVCVDTMNDTAHCGQCGQSCPGTYRCCTGMCYQDSVCVSTGFDNANGKTDQLYDLLAEILKSIDDASKNIIHCIDGGC